MMSDWDQLRSDCLSCQKCALADTRTNVVFGVGAEDAQVMLVGEGPGEQEDLTGEPFVGRGGQLLDEMLSLVGLDRKANVYIANIVKCRPPQNRDPLNTEQDACIGYLRHQVALLRPKIIVCLGRVAANRLIHSDYKITQEHGQWVEKAGVYMTSIYHPAALLRDPSKKPDTFVDLKNIQRKIRQLCPEVTLLSPIR
jgi:DNA polymerase